MRLTQNINGSGATMFIAGRVEASAVSDLHADIGLMLENEAIRTLNIDLTRVEFIDSTVLGCFLVIEAKAKSKNIDLALVGCTGTVKDILNIANFGKIFPMR